MRDRKNEFLFLFPLVFFYLIFDILLIYLPLDSMVSKSLVVGNILIFSPLVTLLGVFSICSILWICIAFFTLSWPSIFADNFYLWRMDSSLSLGLFSFFTGW